MGLVLIVISHDMLTVFFDFVMVSNEQTTVRNCKINGYLANVKIFHGKNENFRYICLG